jgi:hypothetical protein
MITELQIRGQSVPASRYCAGTAILKAFEVSEKKVN